MPTPGSLSSTKGRQRASVSAAANKPLKIISYRVRVWRPHRAEIRVSGPALVWRESSSTPMGCWPNPAPAAAGRPPGAPGPPPGPCPTDGLSASLSEPLQLCPLAPSRESPLLQGHSCFWQGATLRRPHSHTRYTQRKGPRALALPSCALAMWGRGAVMVNLMCQLDGSGESPDVWVCL